MVRGGARGAAGVLDRRRRRRSAALEPARQDRPRSSSAQRGLQAIKTDMRARLTAIPLLKMTVADPEFMQGAP